MRKVFIYSVTETDDPLALIFRAMWFLKSNFRVGWLLVCAWLLLALPLSAQRLSLHTNTVEWLVASPNIGAEFGLGNHLSTEISVSGNPCKVSNQWYLKHFRVQPEVKYWIKNLMTGHYVGFTAFYAGFDLGLKQRAYYGDAYAAGLTYGYSWILSRRWNIEVSAGAGVTGYRLTRYLPGNEHPNPDERGWKPVPVKLGLSFIYIIK